MQKYIDILTSVFKDATTACYELFKIMIPVIIGVKILQELNLIHYIAMPLKPIMGLLGLPAELGLAWASAMMNTLYAGLIVFLSLARDMNLTTEQVTVFSILILIGHGFLVEGAIAQRSGAKYLFQILTRFVGAFTLGFILHHIYSSTGSLQEPATIVFHSTTNTDLTLMQWAWGEATNLLSIFGIVLGLMIMMPHPDGHPCRGIDERHPAPDTQTDRHRAQSVHHHHRRLHSRPDVWGRTHYR